MIKMNTDGHQAIGASAVSQPASTTYNIIIGLGSDIENGDHNIVMGTNSVVKSGSRNIILAHNVQVEGDDNFVLVDGTIVSGNNQMFLGTRNSNEPAMTHEEFVQNFRIKLLKAINFNSKDLN